jgi:phage-related protein
MELLYPQFLWALFFLAIPVIVHLFNLRRYKILKFSGIRFLKQITEETQKQSKLKHLLILLSRLLAVLFLVLAFTQPVIFNQKQQSNTGEKLISIFIDNSNSIQNSSNDIDELENAKSFARSIVKAFSNNERFILQTNNFDVKYQRTFSKSEILKEIDLIQIAQNSSSIHEMHQKANHILNSVLMSNFQHQIYFISDNQLPQHQISELKLTQNEQLFLVNNSHFPEDNLSLDSLWLEQPIIKVAETFNLQFKIKNHGANDFQLFPVYLKLNNESKSPVNISLSSNQSQVGTFSISVADTGNYFGEIYIEDNQYTFDNKLFFSFKVESSIAVIHLFNKNPNKYIQTALQTEPSLAVKSYYIKAVDFSALFNCEVLVLDHLDQYSSGLTSSLNQFLEQGKTIILFPSNNLNFNEFNALGNSLNWFSNLKVDTNVTQISKLNTESAILKNVFQSKEKQINLPNIGKRYYFQAFPSVFEDWQLKLYSNYTHTALYAVDGGKILFFGSDLNDPQNGIPQHAVFLPIFLQTIFRSKSISSIYFTSNAPFVVKLPSKNIDITNLTINSIDNSIQIKPYSYKTKNAYSIQVFANQLKAGHYLIHDNAELNAPLSINLSNNESSILYFTKNDILNLSPNLSNQIFEFSSDISSEKLELNIRSMNFGTSLWKYFIIAALCFLLAEILLLKLK